MPLDNPNSLPVNQLQNIPTVQVAFEPSEEGEVKLLHELSRNYCHSPSGSNAKLTIGISSYSIMGSS
ncbi:hypothetical protein LC608_36430 [Nostoc sp. XA010]|uniref:hypothetical protein n=1 Tax=Nostoc sp. XA010 TaxID=2780407 RepID=UPI001E4AA2ED|nr:hypothetical protein [Nostoc sp. XA010]MCC5662296.1 hypothetical protein [Nostoc sp. XA010]